MQFAISVAVKLEEEFLTRLINEDDDFEDTNWSDDDDTNKDDDTSTDDDDDLETDDEEATTEEE